MRYFNYLSGEKTKEFFYKEPQNFNKYSKKEDLEISLGATLYMPATRENIAEEIINKKNINLASIVICLEDAIGDEEVLEAERNLIKNIKKIYNYALTKENYIKNELPLIFLRLRDSEQILRIYEELGKSIKLLTGFVLAKTNPLNINKYLKNIRMINKEEKENFYAMPILESKDIIYKELREENLSLLKKSFDKNKDLILNLRIGATDFSNIYGIRRNFNTTIYDVAVIRDCISDIVNKFGRCEEEYIISGPVWEYFSNEGARILKPKLRETPFRKDYGDVGLNFRKKILKSYTDGLMEEIILDKINGLTGKTIIHPSHILPVLSLYVVSHEEYIDAYNIIKKDDGQKGVFKSSYSNKMNEIKTHINWARKIMRLSKIYGVFNKDEEFTKLLYV